MQYHWIVIFLLEHIRQCTSQGLQVTGSGRAEVQLLAGSSVTLNCTITTTQQANYTLVWSTRNHDSAGKETVQDHVFLLWDTKSVRIIKVYEQAGFIAQWRADANKAHIELTLKDVGEKHDFDVFCSAMKYQQSNVVEKGDVTKLTVLYPPSQPMIEGSEAGELRVKRATEPVAITCFTSGAKPAAEVTWLNESGHTVDRSKVVTEQRVTPGTTLRRDTISRLFLTADELKRNRAFTCRTRNPATSGVWYSTHVLLNVLYAPIARIEQQSSISGFIWENSDSLFACRADANPTAVNYSWYIDNNKLETEKPRSLGLMTTQLRAEHNGASLRCTASNSVGEGHSYLKLNVSYIHIDLGVPAVIGAELGARKMMSCSVQSNPPAKVYWKFNGKKIKDGANLLLDNMSAQDFGDYECEALIEQLPKSPYNPRSSKVTVAQKVIPYPLPVEHSYVEVLKGDTATLSCSFYAVPTGSITWTGSKGDIRTGGRFIISNEESGTTQTSTLQIESVQATEAGLYNCTVRNEMGTNLTVREIIVTHEQSSSDDGGIPLYIPAGAAVAGLIIVILLIIITVVICRYQGCCRKNKTSERSIKYTSSLGSAPDKVTCIPVVGSSSLGDEFLENPPDLLQRTVTFSTDLPTVSNYSIYETESSHNGADDSFDALPPPPLDEDPQTPDTPDSLVPEMPELTSPLDKVRGYVYSLPHRRREQQPSPTYQFSLPRSTANAAPGERWSDQLEQMVNNSQNRSTPLMQLQVPQVKFRTSRPQVHCPPVPSLDSTDLEPPPPPPPLDEYEPHDAGYDKPREDFEPKMEPLLAKHLLHSVV